MTTTRLPRPSRSAAGPDPALRTDPRAPHAGDEDVDEELAAILEANDEVPPHTEDAELAAGAILGDDDLLAETLAETFDPDDAPLPRWEHVRRQQ